MPGYEANTIDTDLAAAAARKDHAFFNGGMFALCRLAID